jgi:hypothetical protein
MEIIAEKSFGFTPNLTRVLYVHIDEMSMASQRSTNLSMITATSPTIKQQKQQQQQKQQLIWQSLRLYDGERFQKRARSFPLPEEWQEADCRWAVLDRKLAVVCKCKTFYN